MTIMQLCDAGQCVCVFYKTKYLIRSLQLCSCIQYEIEFRYNCPECNMKVTIWLEMAAKFCILL